MSDSIGRIVVPEPTASGLTFNLVSEYSGYSQEHNIVGHRFGALEVKSEQRFYTGFGPKKWTFKRSNLSRVDRQYLAEFFESVKGGYYSFTYNVPNPEAVSSPWSTAHTVVFESQ